MGAGMNSHVNTSRMLFPRGGLQAVGMQRHPPGSSREAGLILLYQKDLWFLGVLACVLQRVKAEPQEGKTIRHRLSAHGRGSLCSHRDRGLGGHRSPQLTVLGDRNRHPQAAESSR